MSHAAEFRMLGKLFKLFNNLVVTQVHPAYDCANERILVGHFQKPSALFETLASLHRNRAMNTSRTYEWHQVGRQIIPAQLFHLTSHPHVLAIVVLPEMLVRVDSHHSYTKVCRLIERCSTKPQPRLPRTSQLCAGLARC